MQMDLSRAESSRIRGQNQIQSTRTTGEILPTFTTHETSVTGKCETLYTITRLPEYLIREFEEEQTTGTSLCEGKEYFEILKTVDYNKCSERPVYHKSYGSRSVTDGSESSSVPSHSSVTRTIICGSIEDHIIRKVVTENKITSTPSEIDVSSVSTLVLESVEGIREELSGLSSPKEYPSLILEYPTGSPLTQGRRVGATIPLPDLTSAPNMFIPRLESGSELKEKAIKVITELVEASEKMSESSVSEKDVAGLTVVATRILGQLSFEELKEVEETIKSKFGEEKWESLVEMAFYDLVSITGTNPCVKLVKEKVMSGEHMENPTAWSFIISKTLRSIKTPTEEVIGELVELLKTEHIQRHRVVRAAFVMGLTELVHKACISPVTKNTEFPTKIYGGEFSMLGNWANAGLVDKFSETHNKSSSDNSVPLDVFSLQELNKFTNDFLSRSFDRSQSLGNDERPSSRVFHVLTSHNLFLDKLDTGVGTSNGHQVVESHFNQRFILFLSKLGLNGLFNFLQLFIAQLSNDAGSNKSQTSNILSRDRAFTHLLRGLNKLSENLDNLLLQFASRFKSGDEHVRSRSQVRKRDGGTNSSALGQMGARRVFQNKRGILLGRRRSRKLRSDAFNRLQNKSGDRRNINFRRSRGNLVLSDNLSDDMVLNGSADDGSGNRRVRGNRGRLRSIGEGPGSVALVVDRALTAFVVVHGLQDFKVFLSFTKASASGLLFLKLSDEVFRKPGDGVKSFTLASDRS